MSSHPTKDLLLSTLYADHTPCSPCPFLHTTEQHRVFGEGNKDAAIMFIGEAPGAEEDRLKRPFVGRAGKLLDSLLASINVTRDAVFITNIVKCRPPHNRTPAPHEISAEMKLLLKKEIQIICPRVICTLGAVATRLFVREFTALSTVRGKEVPFSQGNLIVIPTYHPAYVLRNPAAEKILQHDIQHALKVAKRLSA